MCHMSENILLRKDAPHVKIYTLVARIKAYYPHAEKTSFTMTSFSLPN